MDTVFPGRLHHKSIPEMEWKWEEEVEVEGALPPPATAAAAAAAEGVRREGAVLERM